MSKINVDALLEAYGLRTAKSLGQNFLNDTEILDRICEAACPARGILEIGAGIGSLTGLLAEHCQRAVTVEIDTRLQPLLAAQVPHPNHSFLWQDILKTDLKKVASEFGAPPVIVGNLPYYITTEILMMLLRNPCWEKAVLMVQKEVAQRLTAAPGGKDYRAVTAITQSFCKVEHLFDVAPHYFYPAPHVTSAVIRLTPKTDAPPEREAFIRLVESGFAARRKMFASAPAAQAALKTDREGIKALLRAAELPETARAESFSPGDFKKLYELAQNSKNLI